MMQLPELIADLTHRLDGGDLAGLRQRLHAGDLNELRPLLSTDDWSALPGKIDSGDTGWLQSTLRSIKPATSSLANGAVATGLAGSAGIDAGIDHVDHADVVTGAKVAAGAAATRGVAVGATTAVGTTARAGMAWWKWAFPAVVALGLLALGLTQCKGSTTKASVATTAAPTTVAGVAASASTVAATAAATAAATTVATTAAATTTTASTVAPATTVAAPTKDIVATAVGAGSFATLVTAIKAAGLTDTLSGPGPFTVFAPTDAAFAKLPAGTLEQLIAHPDLLKQVLTYHVLAGKVTAADIKAGDVASVEGAKLTLTTNPVTVNGAKVLTADVGTTNGVIHAIDIVLLPPGFTLPTATPSTPAPAPVATPAAGNGSVDYTVFFDSDSAVIRAEANVVIDEAAAKIKAGSTVVLTGVADTRGNAQSNLELSNRRAQAVADALTAAGANATFEIKARGAEPSDDLQQARRVEIDLP